jgi:alkaline phosphatase
MNPIRHVAGALVAGLTVGGAGTLAVADAPPARNVILLISDGAGPTTWLAANQWQFGPQADSAPEFRQRFQGPEFLEYWMTTYPDNTQPLPPGQVDVRLGLPPGSLPRVLPPLWNELPFPDTGAYDPVAANDLTPGPVRLFAADNGLLLDRGPVQELTPVASNPPAVQILAAQLAAGGVIIPVLDEGFAAYDYLIWNGTTDSAAAGTALASGRKTYNSAINFVDDGETLQPVPFITELVKATGRTAGVVTTKPFTDATPAAFGTQNEYRDNEAEISAALIHNGLLDVIITPGHPEFGSGGVPRDPDFGTISAENLAALRAGVGDWTLVEDAPGLEAIAAGTAPAPGRLFGLVPVSSSLNSRDTTGRTNAYDPRVFDPADPNGAVPFVMPDLPVLTQAAIRSLAQDPDGFLLVVEGASVDSAAHGNDLPRLVEEQLAFNRAVDAVIDWVETESSWEETLVIITTDHANALLLGPDSDTIAFQPPVAGAAGTMPEGIFWSTNHTNELVPLWARGPGASEFAALVDGVDPVRGPYVDNTDVHTVMTAVIEAAGTPCADRDGDGVVGFSDVLIVLAAFGDGNPDGDVDGSGTVDFGDVLVVLAQFGTGCD